MLDSFALNGRVGDIGIKDKVIEVKLVFPNDERTQDELAYLFPIKKGLATVRILAAVNVGYTPGRRRTDRDETGTPLLPGVDMSEICHACGRTVDCVNEPFFAKPVPDGKEIILCDACYRVPQPETIETPPNPEEEKEGDPDTAKCEDCLNFKPPVNEGVEEGVCAVHAGDPLGAYKKPGEIACDKFAAKPLLMEDEESPAPDTLLGFPIVEDPSLQSGEVVFGTVEQIGDPDLVTKFTKPPTEDTKDVPPPPGPKVCAECGHEYMQPYIKENKKGKSFQRFWEHFDEGQKCPACGVMNQFPEEGGGDDGQAAEGGEG